MGSEPHVPEVPTINLAPAVRRLVKAPPFLFVGAVFYIVGLSRIVAQERSCLTNTLRMVGEHT